MAENWLELRDRLAIRDVHAFARLVSHPTAAERAALGELLGEDRCERLRDLSLRRGRPGDLSDSRGNVVVLHGFMGSELLAMSGDGSAEPIWLRARPLAAGGMARLRLAQDGRTDAEEGVAIRPGGIIGRHYGELLLTLASAWDVRAFAYDWRKDIAIAASELETSLREWFADGVPVHLLGHGMGGLVARRFAAQYPERWASMADGPGLARGGRLVMLGTPNHGAPTVAQLLAGIDPLLRKLAAVDLVHGERELWEVLASFPSLYQLLPPPAGSDKQAPLYRASTWGDLDVHQSYLDLAREHHRLLEGDGDGRMVVVAGVGTPTVTRLDAARPRDAAAYEITADGDSHVPRASACLDGAGSTYCVERAHGDLLQDRELLRALPELLATGRTELLTAALADRGGDAGAAYRAMIAADARMLDELAKRQPQAGEARGSRHLGTEQEREVEDVLVQGLLAGKQSIPAPVAAAPAAASAAVEISVVNATIETAHATADAVDAVAVGHYVDVPPQAAEAKLDEAISGAGATEPERLINALTNRGVLAGRLGELFLMPDPRDRDRLIVLAGMGEPGRFGVPELTVLARELCWSLGKLGKRHLATVLIGAGNGNLTVAEAIEGWLRGISLALVGSPGETLEKITIVEEDPRKVPRIHRAIQHLCKQPWAAVEYRPPSGFDAIKQAAYARDKQELDALWKAAERDGVPQRSDAAPVPTRISLALEGQTYRYGAITADASVPERTVPLDPELVREANDELAAERRLGGQMERGEFLGRLVLPRDLAVHLDGNAPIVMLLDDATARINWEMVATGSPGPSGADDEQALGRFLGTSRGFTRQLRTRLAPPPDPPPPPRRDLRVLVIADPAEDHPLLGAQEEGQEVAELFSSFTRVWSHTVEVTTLFGSHEASRTNVLRHLMATRYDVLHYAGHCTYDTQDPARSGWIFTGGRRLGVNELSRVDRIPKFVFSNACESGVTADDARGATSDLAPGFAHAFFARGVSNFVCTAWPVNDRAAREFARVLYRQMLALPEASEAPPSRAAAMHEAMRMARRAVAQTPDGRRTWGAYQHYGNPHFRLFEPLMAHEQAERRVDGASRVSARIPVGD